MDGTVDTDHADANLSKTQPELSIDEKNYLPKMKLSGQRDYIIMRSDFKYEFLVI